MAGCGTCPDSCNCVVASGDGVTVTGDGSSDSPYVVSADGEAWAGTSPDDSIDIANLGADNGHSPELTVNINPAGGLLNGGGGIQILIDPASTAPISEGVAGLRVDCCPYASPATDDTPTVDLVDTFGILSANVIPNTLAGLENQAGGVAIKLEDDPAAVAGSAGNNLLRFTAAGELTLQAEDAAAAVGMEARAVTGGSDVNLSNTVGVNSGNSFSATISNPTIVPMFVRLEGIAHLESEATGADTLFRVWNPMAILDISSGSGGALDIGSNGLFAPAEFGDGAAGGFTRIDRGHLAKWAYIPPGGSITFTSYMKPLLTAVGWTTTVGAGGFYVFENVQLAVYPARAGGWGL